MKARSLVEILRFYDDNRKKLSFFWLTSSDSNSCISRLREISRGSDRNADLNIDAIRRLLASEPSVGQSQDFASLTATQKTIEVVRFECGLPCHPDAHSASPLITVYGVTIESDIVKYLADFNAKSLCPKKYTEMCDDERDKFKAQIEDGSYNDSLPFDYEGLGDDSKEKILELISRSMRLRTFSTYLTSVEDRILEKYRLPPGDARRGDNQKSIKLTNANAEDLERQAKDWDANHSVANHSMR